MLSGIMSVKITLHTHTHTHTLGSCTPCSICQMIAKARFKRTDRPLAFKARQLDSTLQAQLRNMIGCLLCKIMKVAGAITANKKRHAAWALLGHLRALLEVVGGPCGDIVLAVDDLLQAWQFKPLV